MRNPMIHFTAIASLVVFAGCAEAQTGQKNTTSANAAVAQPADLDPQAFQQAIQAGKAKLVDVRTPSEYASGHIAGSVNIDWTGSDYEKQFATLDPKQPLLIYCRSGGRSGQAMAYLKEKGYTVQHLDGGISAWMNAGLPTE